ncbi:hypothetical protein OCU04_000086 [Sclerotinia nivalis]|uniref:Short chain dehydrogenase n=1 Tax=Sclerotinia nivalis TaxID=352851 RepID=A0A9X0AWF1_9HELO|nr:hypothetical protein OCU04_000086 [Sclerotinia nivalis]
MSTSKSVLIVGANRGIGLNLLEATGAKILEIDFLDEKSIANSAKDFGNQRLDVLLNVGGLPSKPKSWRDQTPELFTERFQVMAVGPFLTIKHFLPNLEKSNTARVVNISSAFGSVTDNTFGTCMAYRAAKSALNQVTMTYARELEKEGKNITFACMEPGFLPTRLTEYDSVDYMETCIAGIVKVVEGLTMADNGQFIEWSGKRLQY